jgi:hypothetical protein
MRTKIASEKVEKSAALRFVTLAWECLPHGSWRRLNSAMFRTLKTAILGGMHFEPGDVTAIYKAFNAAHWIGEADEVLYAMACAGESGANVPAAMAWEAHFGRPAYLWAEKTKTPERLHVGAEFTWQGQLVKVTSFDESGTYLTACSYKDRGRIDRRFKVTHAELVARRKDYDDRRRAMQRQLVACETMEALESAWAPLAGHTVKELDFRHFDVEMIRASYATAKERIRDRLCEGAGPEDVENSPEQMEAVRRWMDGEAVSVYLGGTVKLRVKDGMVETSNGQCASVAAVRKTLKFLKRVRAKGWQRNGEEFEVDRHSLERVDGRGVKVGCTFVAWDEVDRIAAILEEKK